MWEEVSEWKRPQPYTALERQLGTLNTDNVNRQDPPWVVDSVVELQRERFGKSLYKSNSQVFEASLSLSLLFIVRSLICIVLLSFVKIIQNYYSTSIIIKVLLWFNTIEIRICQLKVFVALLIWFTTSAWDCLKPSMPSMFFLENSHKSAFIWNPVLSAIFTTLSMLSCHIFLKVINISQYSCKLACCFWCLGTIIILLYDC